MININTHVHVFFSHLSNIFTFLVSLHIHTEKHSQVNQLNSVESIKCFNIWTNQFFSRLNKFSIDATKTFRRNTTYLLAWTNFCSFKRSVCPYLKKNLVDSTKWLSQCILLQATRRLRDATHSRFSRRGARPRFLRDSWIVRNARTRSPRACLRPRRKHLGLGTKTQLTSESSRAKLNCAEPKDELAETRRDEAFPATFLEDVPIARVKTLGNAGDWFYRCNASFMHPARRMTGENVACIRICSGESRNWDELRLCSQTRRGITVSSLSLTLIRVLWGELGDKSSN